MAIHSRPIPLPLPLPLPTASRPAATPLAMHSLSHLRLATAYARYVTTSCNRLSKFPVRSAAKVRVSSSNTVDKDRWLDAFSYPLTRKAEVGLDSHSHSDSDLGEVIVGSGSESEWIIGVDPDVHGALALLRPDQSPCGYSAEVFDAPYVNVMVGKRLRKRLDPRSIVQLLHSFNAPIGTKAYIEQSSPFPQDGKQGWWSGGFTYGMWLGVLVASGFSVRPVSSNSWKNFFELSRASSTKDDSRKSASDMFPSLASMLKRKKDHGRAEALLIAAYGRSLTLQSNLNSTLIESKELELLSC
ncbi:MutS2 [Rhynchospora pubera]|uniref:MutS2 n=1 Tax=Rhynchospora pubera TaxID=906938 RepID=A0AAV8HFX1_9POAL|nr:MutS2 [Rhynchospora pubera]